MHLPLRHYEINDFINKTGKCWERNVRQAAALNSLKSERSHCIDAAKNKSSAAMTRHPTSAGRCPDVHLRVSVDVLYKGRFISKRWPWPVVVVVVMTSPSGTAYMGGQMSRRDEEFHRLWIRRDLSLPRGSWQPFINWGTTQGRLLLPTADVLLTIVKRSMLTDVDKLPSCSRFSDSVVGFTGQKTQPTAS